MYFLIIFIFKRNIVSVQGILGGHDIEIEEAPYQINYGDICGGVLVHQIWALTSAHCGTKLDYIRVGSKYRLKGTKVIVISHIVHPKYGNNHKFDYDIQLLKLRRRLHFYEKVKSIDISSGELGGSILVAGWGYLKENGEYTETLQQVQLKMESFDRCQRVEQLWYNHSLTSRMFCAGGADAEDACQGDSGGGAVSFGFLVGLSSFGYGCGRKIPGVFTKVSHPGIRKWIRYHTEV